MDRLFLDANVLFSAAHRANAGLLQLWKLKNVDLLSSQYAVEEARINLTEDPQRHRLSRLVQSVQLFEAVPIELSRGILLPEKDKPILLAAIAAHATHLITGDLRHFGRYLGKRVEGILLLTPSSYLKAGGRR